MEYEDFPMITSVITIILKLSCARIYAVTVKMFNLYSKIIILILCTNIFKDIHRSPKLMSEIVSLTDEVQNDTCSMQLEQPLELK